MNDTMDINPKDILNDTILSSDEFILTRTHLIHMQLKKTIPLVEIDSVNLIDNKDKLKIVGLIAMVILSAGIFAYNYLSKGYIDDSFGIVALVCIMVYFVTLNRRKTELIVTTVSGEKHIVATKPETVYLSYNAIRVAVIFNIIRMIPNLEGK